MKTYQVGDQVIIRNGYQSGEPFKIRKIIGVTKMQIKVDGGDKFMIKTGKKIGGNGWYQDSLDRWGEITFEEAIKQNAEWKKENDMKSLRRSVEYIEWHLVTDEKMVRIKKILDE